MSENLEIERKFFVEMPDLKLLNVRREIDILQIYLNDGENGSQRRVRWIAENGEERFVYTEKIFYTAVTRKETEYDISRKKYDELLKDVKQSLSPVSKKRICFEYLGQLFELDIYPFSDSRAILELELENADQEIFFPDCINVIKEVTGVEGYSNSVLGKAGAFPEEDPAEGDS